MTTAARDFLDAVLNGQRTPAVAVGRRRGERGSGAPGAVKLPAARRAIRPLSKRGAELKGRRLQNMARDYFLSLGMRVEVAQKKVLWVPGPGGRRVPISRKHDYFGLWDMIVVAREVRYFVQVTTIQHVAAKRNEILASGFPTLTEDLVLGYEGRRTFRVLRGPLFETGEERIRVPVVRRARST